MLHLSNIISSLIGPTRRPLRLFQFFYTNKVKERERERIRSASVQRILYLSFSSSWFCYVGQGGPGDISDPFPRFHENRRGQFSDGREPAWAAQQWTSPPSDITLSTDCNVLSSDGLRASIKTGCIRSMGHQCSCPSWSHSSSCPHRECRRMLASLLPFAALLLLAAGSSNTVWAASPSTSFG